MWREPSADGQSPFGARYLQQTIVLETDSVRARFAPEVEVPIEEMLPPREA